MKRIIYTLLTIILCLELSFLLHSFLEYWYIAYSLDRGLLLTNTAFLGRFYSVMPSAFNYTLLLVSIVGGFILSRIWWRMVYINKSHWRL